MLGKTTNKPMSWKTEDATANTKHLTSQTEHRWVQTVRPDPSWHRPCPELRTLCSLLEGVKPVNCITHTHIYTHTKTRTHTHAHTHTHTHTNTYKHTAEDSLSHLSLNQHHCRHHHLPSSADAAVMLLELTPAPMAFNLRLFLEPNATLLWAPALHHSWLTSPLTNPASPSLHPYTHTDGHCVHRETQRCCLPLSPSLFLLLFSYDGLPKINK